MIHLTAQEELLFRSKIAVLGTDQCWEWTAAKNGGRALGWYGYFSRSRQQVREQGGPRCFYAHRLMFCLARGWPLDYLTTEQAVMHTCDNHLCCNPCHLELGTQLTNIQDMVAKRRNVRGSRVRGSKLCEARVRIIKNRLSADEDHAVIAADFGVTRAAVTAIAVGRNWSWVSAQEIPV